MNDNFLLIARIIARIRPEIWDLIVPHGPLTAGPSPQPWQMGPHPDPWWVAGPVPDPWLTNGPLPDPWLRGRGVRVAGPFPEPWRFASRFESVALNPQPLPPAELYAISAADAMITRVVALAEAAETAGNSRGIDVAGSLIAEWDELCPRWPKFKIPKGVWPPPPPPPDWLGSEMSETAHFLAAARVLAASEAISDQGLASRMAEAGSNQLQASLSRMG